MRLEAQRQRRAAGRVEAEQQQGERRRKPGGEKAAADRAASECATGDGRDGQQSAQSEVMLQTNEPT